MLRNFGVVDDCSVYHPTVVLALVLAPAVSAGVGTTFLIDACSRLDGRKYLSERLEPSVDGRIAEEVENWLRRK